MEKLDLTKKYKSYFKAGNIPELVSIEPAQFISVTGQGDPAGEAFADRLQALYPLAYAIKFACKKAGRDFTVSKLEGLWWFDEAKYKDIPMAETPGLVPRSEWYYRLMIRMPDFVTEGDLHAAIKTVAAKKPAAAINEVTWFTMEEGMCVQMLHNGPFDREPETLALMLAFIQEKGLGRNGLHHEIYLSDFRKTSPDKYRTILREPVS